MKSGTKTARKDLDCEKQKCLAKDLFPGAEATDAVYGSDLVQKFINSMMWDGKRSTAQRIFYGAMEQIGARRPTTSRSRFSRRPSRTSSRCWK